MMNFVITSMRIANVDLNYKWASLDQILNDSPNYLSLIIFSLRYLYLEEPNVKRCILSYGIFLLTEAESDTETEKEMVCMKL